MIQTLDVCGFDIGFKIKHLRENQEIPYGSIYLHTFMTKIGVFHVFAVPATEEKKCKK